FLGNPRWYIWGLVIVLAIVAVYTTLAVQRNLWPFQIEKPIVANSHPSPTISSIPDISSWKTYSNTQYGFEFEYPGDWTVIASTNSGGPYLVFLSLGPSESIQSGGTMAITVRTETVEEYLSLLKSYNNTVVSSKDEIVGGRSATYYQFKRNDALQDSHIVAFSNYLIEIISGSGDGNSQTKIFNQILSTFKFIEPLPDYRSLNFQCDERYGCYGILNLTGYINIVHKVCEPNSPCFATVDYVLFKIINDNYPLLIQFLKENYGNAFLGNDWIGLGCYQKDKNQIYSYNKADDGNIDNVISGDELTTLMGSSMQKPVQLTATKSIVTNGMGASECYSDFINFKVD
ncbi:MAG: hypothetical protein ABR875_04260, partial [Minisyncoccia bacterium]